jgi:TetR/AcrR family transcriptional regulator, transcriptional repressor for nem operon
MPLERCGGGSASLNFRDLGGSVGVKSSTVHYYFPTKADLLKEIAGEYKAIFIATLDERTRESKSFKQDLLVLVDLFLGAQGEKLSCLCGMLATEAELLDSEGEVRGQRVLREAAGVGHAAGKSVECS